jgi:hypothetical protein
MMHDVLLIVAILVAMPFAICLFLAAAIGFLAYALWVIELFGRMMERAFPSLRG